MSAVTPELRASLVLCRSCMAAMYVANAWHGCMPAPRQSQSAACVLLPVHPCRLSCCSPPRSCLLLKKILLTKEDDLQDSSSVGQPGPALGAAARPSGGLHRCIPGPGPSGSLLHDARFRCHAASVSRVPELHLPALGFVTGLGACRGTLVSKIAAAADLVGCQAEAVRLTRHHT